MNTFIPRQDALGSRLSKMANQSPVLHFDEEQERDIERLVGELEHIFKASED